MEGLRVNISMDASEGFLIEIEQKDEDYGVGRTNFPTAQPQGYHRRCV